jgi:RNA polymerase sigma-70 factor (ECF subfamily)
MPPKPTELEGLLSAVAAGDREAFAALYRATSAKLYGVALRILRRRDLADEVIQETYVRIWNSAGTFDAARASPITWMVTIARNRALDEVRRRTPLAIDTTPEALDVADEGVLASQHVELASELARLRACLEGLEPEKRDIVRLAYLDGLSREELGARLGHPPGTIKTWPHRSLKQLKACLTS